LTEIGHQIGLASTERLALLQRTKEKSNQIINLLETTSVSPDEINKKLELTSPIKEKMKAAKLLLRPEIELKHLEPYLLIQPENYTFEEKLRAEIKIKYETYIQREKEQADKLQRLEYIKIPKDFNYHKITALSMESREKLTRIKPLTIAQAKQISGVSPSDISVLLIHFGR
jgi:tRNA uridine 5-carboxymethylaminomethyl modification enzyme